MAKLSRTSPYESLQAILREEFGRRTIENTQLPEYFHSSISPALKLRPYQEECFKYFLNYWENSFNQKEAQTQLLFHMATGSGKTLIMAGLMLYLYEKGYRNFLFFVNSTNIIEKTKDNFINQASGKYLFAPTIQIGSKRVEIKLVENFQGVSDDCINLCLTTIQGLHISLNNPRENSLTYDDFADHDIVLISDEAHHINTSTKKGKKEDAIQGALDFGGDFSDDWETTVMRIFRSNGRNVLLEFTATCDMTDQNISEKYANKIIFDYPLKKFREDGYSKDIEVVQSDLQPIDRAVQTAILNQYKRKLFATIGQDIKPVMMLKSKTIAANKEFFDLFRETIRGLNVKDMKKIRGNAKGDILEAFRFFEEKNVTPENLLLELKEDFKEDNLLLVDGNNISPEKQIILNSLEAKDNEFRAVFAVDMLNEGWDVLNLYDIVRLYEGRDAKDNKPGKTTMQEAQLIGRGARYMPFTAPEPDKPEGKRKYDNDISNRLRTVEKLHYHSSYNPRYVRELTTAMEETGIMARETKEILHTLKESFKRTKLYREGYVFENERESYFLNDNVNKFGDHILNHTFHVHIRSGEMRSSLVFEKANPDNDLATRERNFKLRQFGKNIIRGAINRLENYKFSALRELFPSLSSVKYFIESPDFLADIAVTVSAREDLLNHLSQRDKLGIVIEVLRQIEPMIAKSGVGERGTRNLSPRALRDLITDSTSKISLDGTEDKEYGRSMKESTNPDLAMDLSREDWYAFKDCFGTSEEKQLVRYIASIIPRLKRHYEDIYLVRNERKVKIYDFDQGRGFEPDFILFLRRGGKNFQVFIEPKGPHLKEHDRWKEDFLLRLKTEADITFATNKVVFTILGLPMYTHQNRRAFDQAIVNELGLEEQDL